MRNTTDYIENWLDGLSERTKQNYVKEFEKWQAWLNMSPQEQIEKRLKDTSSTNHSERNFFEQKFRAYKEHLEKTTELKPLSIKTQLRTVASFFTRNGYPLNLKRGDWESTLTTEVIHRFKLEKDDVKKMYAHASLRDRALLLILAQSGFSEIDASVLKIEDLKGLYDMPQSEHYFIEKPREKTNVIQATCLSYEALHDIRALIEETQQKEGYIFKSTTRTKGTTKKEREESKNTPIEVRRINSAMKTLAKKALGEKAEKFKTKALRSFYNSALLRVLDAKSEIKDVMMGHKRLGARGHYAYDEYTIREAYTKAFEYLTINGIQAREDIAKFKQQTNTIIGQQQRQIEQQNKKLENLENLVKQLLEHAQQQEFNVLSTPEGKERMKQFAKQQEDTVKQAQQQ